jgi:hypothetical protein
VSDLTVQRPDVLTVTATAPGAIVISRGFAQIGRFVLGRFYPAQPTPFVFRALGQYLAGHVEGHSLAQDQGYPDMYFRAIEYVLAQIEDRGHGGTVVLLRSDALEGALRDTAVRYLVRDTLHMREAFHQLLRWSHSRDVDTILIVAATKELRERLDFLAQLACVDGALLLGDSMAPVGYGATLQAQTWTGDVVPGPAPQADQVQLLNLRQLGTRHNSAASFAAAHPGSIAFVISHDGPIRAFLREEGGPLLYWADCTLSMFV